MSALSPASSRSLTENSKEPSPGMRPSSLRNSDTASPTALQMLVMAGPYTAHVAVRASGSVWDSH